ncbi:Uncharacterised protein [Klebsiella pneumoniae]|nr:Uncharacterised protein [Klebsiella pneumoniae]
MSDYWHVVIVLISLNGCARSVWVNMYYVVGVCLT